MPEIYALLSKKREEQSGLMLLLRMPGMGFRIDQMVLLRNSGDRLRGSCKVLRRSYDDNQISLIAAFDVIDRG